MPLNRTPLTKAFWRHLAFLPSRTWLNLTVIQIRQLKRSYSRRLKFDLAFYVYHGRYTTCLPFNESRCQNQSTPFLVICSINSLTQRVKAKIDKSLNISATTYINTSNYIPNAYGCQIVPS